MANAYKKQKKPLAHIIDMCGLTQSEAAAKLGCTVKHLKEVINEDDELATHYILAFRPLLGRKLAMLLHAKELADMRTTHHAMRYLKKPKGKK